MHRRDRYTAASFALFALLLSACQRPTPAPAPETPPEPQASQADTAG